MPQPFFTLLAAMLLAMAWAGLEDRSRQDRWRVAVRVFLCCVMTTLGGSWLMRLIHG